MDKKTNVFYLHRDELRQLDEYFDSIGEHKTWNFLTDEYNQRHREEHAKIPGGVNDMQHEFCQWAQGKPWDEIMKG